MKFQVILEVARLLSAQIPLLAQEPDLPWLLSLTRVSFAMTLVPCVGWTRSNFCCNRVLPFVTFTDSLL